MNSELQVARFRRILTQPVERRSKPRHLTRAALKRFWLGLIPLTLLCGAAFFYAFALLLRVDQTERAAQTRAVIEIARDQASHEFHTVYGDLHFVAGSQRVRRLLQHPDDDALRQQLEQALLNMAHTHTIYDQIRLLSASGMELVRINYNHGQPAIAARSELQNKAGRYYFNEASQVAEGLVYVSQLDLNVEQGQIERPFKPTVRFAQPVRDAAGQLLGVVVLNYLGEGLLQNIRRQLNSLAGDSMLVNNEGYWLSNRDAQKEWGFMFGGAVSFAAEHPEVWRQIRQREGGMVDLDGKRYVYATVKPLPPKLLAHKSVGSALGDWKIIVIGAMPGLRWGYVASHMGYVYPLLFGYPIALLMLWFWARASAGRALAERGLKELNLSLERQVAARTRELRATKDATIMSLASLAETRDNETGQHIRRAQHYVKTLAEALQEHPDFRHQLSDEAIELIYKSAPLHDIGKVGIPDAILLKPGRLSVDEFEIMKTHTTLGSDAIEEAINTLAASLEPDGAGTFLHYARDIAHYHHERWDGGGYPKGLCGDAIPLAARLMAIADVYDALVNARVYKPAFSRDKAERIILKECEGQFDPRILAAFERCREQFWAIKQRFREPVGSAAAQA